MKKLLTKIVVPLITLLAATATAQTLEHWPPNVSSLYATDAVKIKVLGEKARGKKKVFINELAVDSSGIMLNLFIFVRGSKDLFAFYGDYDNLKIFKVSENGIEKIADLKNKYFVTDQDFRLDQFILVEGYDYLFKLDINTHAILRLLDLRKHSNEIIELSFSPQLPIALISLGEYVGGGYDTYQYVIIDLQTGQTRDVSDYLRKVLPEYSSTQLPTGLWYEYSSNSHVFMQSDIYLREQMKDYFVFDSEFNFIGRTLAKRLEIHGKNFRKEKLVSYNLKVRLDKRDVLFEYMPSYEVERLCHRILYDSAIRAEDLKKLSKEERRLVKNFVFAKHNYGFEDEYLQAYFCTFAFYNAEEKRKSRIKDVNALLTAMDKKNLALINSR